MVRPIAKPMERLCINRERRANPTANLTGNRRLCRCRHSFYLLSASPSLLRLSWRPQPQFVSLLLILIDRSSLIISSPNFDILFYAIYSILNVLIGLFFLYQIRNWIKSLEKWNIWTLIYCNCVASEKQLADSEKYGMQKVHSRFIKVAKYTPSVP